MGGEKMRMREGGMDRWEGKKNLVMWGIWDECDEVLDTYGKGETGVDRCRWDGMARKKGGWGWDICFGWWFGWQVGRKKGKGKIKKDGVRKGGERGGEKKKEMRGYFLRRDQKKGGDLMVDKSILRCKKWFGVGSVKWEIWGGGKKSKIEMLICRGMKGKIMCWGTKFMVKDIEYEWIWISI